MNSVHSFRITRNFRWIRRLHTKPAVCNKLQSETKTDWNTAVKDAERVVGYPTSFLNLRWLLNDEVANVALHLRKLIGTEHPLLKTAKDFLLKNETPAWGLIVLLVSRAGGLKHDVMDIERDSTAGILHNQRVLAEVTEMIRTSIMIHKILMSVDRTSENADVLFYGNKIALLSGDYLLSKSFRDLAQLRNQTVNEIISSALRDLSEYEFLGRKDENGASYPEPPTDIERCTAIQDEEEIDFGPYDASKILGNPREEWILRNLLLGASLLGKSCRASLILGGTGQALQEQGYLFGKHLALAWQAKFDYEAFDSGKPLNLVGAPVLLQLCEEPGLYDGIKVSEGNVLECDLEEIRGRVQVGRGLERTKELQDMFVERAMKNLGFFEGSDARSALAKIVGAI